MSTLIRPATDTQPMGVSSKMEIDPVDEETDLPRNIYDDDAAVKEFSAGSLRALTNQKGCDGKKFTVMPSLRPYVEDGYYPESLRTAKPPVQNFWVYDGAVPTIGRNGTTPTSVEQILPASNLREQSFIEWNRVGSKKGWMFHGRPQEDYASPQGENVPTHTDDGFPMQIKQNRWHPMEVDPALQRKAHQEAPAIDIQNNARGIGVTGQGSGNGGMAGGYKEVNPQRLKQLPIPREKFNWTGSRLHGTQRGEKAGGFRSGYKSQYGDFPAVLRAKNTGVRYLNR